MQYIEFVKKDIKFSFRNPKLNEYGKLVMDYKLEGIHENKNDSEGYYNNSEFLPEHKSMSLYGLTLNDKKN